MAGEAGEKFQTVAWSMSGDRGEREGSGGALEGDSCGRDMSETLAIQVRVPCEFPGR